MLSLAIALPAYGQESVTASDLIPKIQVSGGDLDKETTISSLNAVRKKTGLIVKSYDQDNAYLRAFIDRDSKRVTSIQLYYVARYGRDWRFYEASTYETASGVKDGDFKRLGGFVNSCGRYGCFFEEHLVTEIPIDVLRWVREESSKGRTEWRFKLFSKVDAPIEDSLPSAEIDAFLTVLDREEAKMKGPTSP